MFRLTTRRLLFEKLGKTKWGAEVLAQTRSDMRHIERQDNALIRFLMRRRPIDYLAIEVDGPITKELDPSFRYAKHAITFLLCFPVFVWLVSGRMKPTYYLLVPTGVIPEEKYNRMWEFSNWAIVLAAQLFFLLVLYDFSVYIRYPFFARVLAPAYRRMGWTRKTLVRGGTMEELKTEARQAHARPLGKPLGRPLGEVRRDAQKTAAEKPNPFGKPRK